jgi:hypothetical protein
VSTPAPKPLYQQLALRIEAAANCRKTGNAEWLAKHNTLARKLVHEHMPSGAGIERCTIDLDACDRNRLVFTVLFHHMDENGHYDGYTEQHITVTPSLGHDVEIDILGEDRNDVHELLREVFLDALTVTLTDDQIS